MPFFDLFSALSGNQDISLGCTTALLSLTVSSSAASCLNAGALTSFVPAVSGSSMIPPTITYLNGFCPLPSCSDDQIQSIVETVMDGCASDIATYGITLPSTNEVVSIAQEAFPTLKQVLCLQESISGSETNCIINILDAFQQDFGAALTVEDLVADVGNVINDSTHLPENITCSMCIEHEMLLVNSTFPIFFTWFDLFPTVEGQCGPEFISTMTSSSSSTPTANATASHSLTVSATSSGLGTTTTGAHTSSTSMKQSSSTSSAATTSTSATLVLNSVTTVNVPSVTLTFGATTDASILPSSSSSSHHTRTDTLSIPSPSIFITATRPKNSSLSEITSTSPISSTAPLSSSSSSTSPKLSHKSKSTISNTITTTTLTHTSSSYVSAPPQLTRSSATLPASATAINTTSATTTKSISFPTSLAGGDTTTAAGSNSPIPSASGSASASQASSNAQTGKGFTAASMALLTLSFALMSFSYI